ARELGEQLMKNRRALKIERPGRDGERSRYNLAAQRHAAERGQERLPAPHVERLGPEFEPHALAGVKGALRVQILDLDMQVVNTENTLCVTHKLPAQCRWCTDGLGKSSLIDQFGSGCIDIELAREIRRLAPELRVQGKWTVHRDRRSHEVGVAHLEVGIDLIGRCRRSLDMDRTPEAPGQG